MGYERIKKELLAKNPKEAKQYKLGMGFEFEKPILVTSTNLTDGEVFTKIGLRKDEMLLIGTYCYARTIPASDYKNVKIL